MTKKLDFQDVKGQEHVKRGLEVAVTGSHNVLLIGPKGSGKEMLAKRVLTITDYNCIYIKDIPLMSKIEADQLSNTMRTDAVVVSMLPCPCGNFTDPKRICNCSSFQIQRYLSKVSPLILDKVDIHIEVPRLNIEHISSKRAGETSMEIKARVERASQKQEVRQITNKRLEHILIEKYCQLDKEAEELLKLAILELGISARSYDKILKVSRTIADMDNKDIIEAHHISEAISYRSLDRNLW